MLQVTTTSPAATRAVAAALTGLARSGDIIVLAGGEGAEAVFGEHLTVRLEPTADDDMARLITIHATGPAWAARWDAVRAAVTSC